MDFENWVNGDRNEVEINEYWNLIRELPEADAEIVR
jgi:hypothetical protein